MKEKKKLGSKIKGAVKFIVEEMKDGLTVGTLFECPACKHVDWESGYLEETLTRMGIDIGKKPISAEEKKMFPLEEKKDKGYTYYCSYCKQAVNGKHIKIANPKKRKK